MGGSNVKLPEGYTVKWDGQFNEMKVAQGKLMVIVPLTILVIFLLLYSTFGNFKDALMVVLNVPFAAIGGLLVYAYTQFQARPWYILLVAVLALTVYRASCGASSFSAVALRRLAPMMPQSPPSSFSTSSVYSA